jgi:hypothetical protein
VAKCGCSAGGKCACDGKTACDCGCGCADGKKKCGCSKDAALARELLDILEHTQSPDTFVVTVKVLSRLDVDRRLMVPAVIRCAERIGLLSDRITGEDSEVPELVVELLGEAKSPAVGSTVGPCAPAPTVAPASYSPLLPPPGR